jgi:indole-3-glycerol phosphate synthase
LAVLETMGSVAHPPSFAAAVAAPGISLIAEVKRRSPSRGPIRPELDVAELVAGYEAAGARAVSVLTEEDFFGGGLDDLRVAREGTRLPLLRKDFVIDVYQIHEARVYGASAVLLIAGLLDDGKMRELAAAASDLGLDVLVEVHDAPQMARALEVETAILGVNNRDLHTFSVSLATTAQLAGLVPKGRLLVSESGVETRDDMDRLAALGVDAVLVGEAILREARPDRVVRALLTPRRRAAGLTMG